MAFLGWYVWVGSSRGWYVWAGSRRDGMCGRGLGGIVCGQDLGVMVCVGGV